MLNAYDYFPGYFFKLSFEGEDAAFQEVSGISRELKVEEIESGGENNYKYKLPSGAKSPNLVLKRALVDKTSKLANWCSQSLDQSFAKPIVPHDISVILLEITDGQGEAKKERRRWTFIKAYPVKYSISDLKSQENGLVIETLELAYLDFKVSSDTSTGGLFK